MSPNEAYRKGQEDMKRRLARRFKGYWFQPAFMAYVKWPRKSPDVPVVIRAHPIRNLKPFEAA